MLFDHAALDALTEKIIGSAIAVHRFLGPGLLESVYRDCLLLELRNREMAVDVERQVPIIYHRQRIATPLKLDLLVDDRVVVEVKAIEAIHPVHLAQVITYLKLTGCPAGLLINFNTTAVRNGIRRLSHPDVYPERQRSGRDSDKQAQRDAEKPWMPPDLL